MKTPKWTKADAKRAEKMGWRLNVGEIVGQATWIERHGNRFKSDDEARWWVISQVELFSSMNIHLRKTSTNLQVHLHWHNTKTCRKALFLCAKG